ncbi:hypothetical protein, partial [Pseudomonas agarici]|uniref:hypothetical protein n=1 Tax=Pseudomonas agarici TaxID=46677 RepID=UPI001B7F83DC
ARERRPILPACAKKVRRYNRQSTTCAHYPSGLSLRHHLLVQAFGCLYRKYKSMKNIVFFYW